jgi:hypothetical protein
MQALKYTYYLIYSCYEIKQNDKTLGAPAFVLGSRKLFKAGFRDLSCMDCSVVANNPIIL